MTTPNSTTVSSLPQVETGNDLVGNFTNVETGGSSSTTAETTVQSTQGIASSQDEITGETSMSEWDSLTASMDQHSQNTLLNPNPPFPIGNLGVEEDDLNQETSTTTTIVDTGNSIIGNFSLVEFGTGSSTLQEHDITQTYDAGVTQQETDSLSGSEIGNSVLGITTISEVSSSQDTINTGTLYGTTGDNDSSTQTTTSTDNTLELDNSLSGANSITDLSGDQSTVHETSMRSGQTSYQLQSLSDTGSLTQIGNDYTGLYTLNQYSGSSVSFQETENTGSASLTLGELNGSTAQVTQTGNVDTGVGTQQATLYSSQTIYEDGNSSNGQSFNLTQVTTDNGNRSQESNSITGQYQLYQTDQVDTSLTDQGIDSSGAFSLTQLSSVSSLESETGNEVTGLYDNGTTSSTGYSLVQTDNAGAFTLRETGTLQTTSDEKGNALTGDDTYSLTGYGTYTMIQTSLDSSGTDHATTVSGLENESSFTTSNTLTGAQSLNETTDGSCTRTQNQTNSLGTTTEISQNTGTVSSTEVQTGNLLTGTNSVSMVAGSTNRYQLLPEYNNAGSANTSTGGTVNFNTAGTPYSVGSDLAGSGQTTTSGSNGASASGTGGAAGVGYNDGGGRLGRLRTGNGAVIDAIAANNGGADVMAQAAGLGAELYKNYCFAAETPIRTPTGSKLIRDIVPGDWVLASPKDRADGPIEAKMVEEVFVNETHLWAVYVQGEKIRTAGEHRFYVLGKGWVKAAGMRQGDLLRSDDGQWMAVEGVEETGDYETVYNFRVADWHTYFVGAIHWGFCVWAHNDYSQFLQTFGLDGLDRNSASSQKLEAFYNEHLSGAGKARGQQEFNDAWNTKGISNTINQGRAELGLSNLNDRELRFPANVGGGDLRPRSWGVIEDDRAAAAIAKGQALLTDTNGGILAFADSHTAAGNIVKAGNRDNPPPQGGEWQSHHGIQQAWAKANLPGYDPKMAPTEVIATGTEHTPDDIIFAHDTITRQQNSRTTNNWDYPLENELENLISDHQAAGFNEATIQKALAQNYLMIKQLETETGQTIMTPEAEKIFQNYGIGSQDDARSKLAS